MVIASGYGLLSVELLLGEKSRTVFMLPKPYDLDALARTLNDAANLQNIVRDSVRVNDVPASRA